MKKIRVLIVEDSKTARQHLEHIIGCDPRLEIAAAVETGEEALRIIEGAAPDVISMDLGLPGMNGFEATERIMQERPTPVVVVSASAGQLNTDALRAGALAVIEKPGGVLSDGFAAEAERLCTQLALMSDVKVIRRRVRKRASAVNVVERDAGKYSLLGIAASTGGPSALLRVLGGLGADFPLPILLVQHIAAGFLAGFAGWLRDATPFDVEIVEHRSLLRPGTIYMAAPDRHLLVSGRFACAGDGKPVSGQRPSGTVLFESMSAACGRRAIGVLLTGMGDDGAEGLLRLRERGAWTIAEHESTAVVYGMPAEAVRLGAVAECVPSEGIAPALLALTRAGREAAR
jgi:two-component system chemotaxis response regulator CheB